MKADEAPPQAPASPAEPPHSDDERPTNGKFLLGLPQPPEAAALSIDPASALIGPEWFAREAMVTTGTGNRVALDSTLCGSVRIHIAGKSVIKSKVVLRGDLAILKVGRFVTIGEGSSLKPARRVVRGEDGQSVLQYIPLTVGDFTTIGAGCRINAAAVGSYVNIGDGCVIEERCVIKDCSTLLPRTVLPPDTHVPPGVVFGGTPGKLLAPHFDSQEMVQKKWAQDCYKLFQTAESPDVA